MQKTELARSLFVDLFTSMHENEAGIALLDNKDYTEILLTILTLNIDLACNVHQIGDQRGQGNLGGTNVRVYLPDREEDFSEVELSEFNY